MIGWVLFLFLVAPFLFAGVALSRLKPAPLPDCPVCRDGLKLARTPVHARKDFKLALKCPECGQLYGAKISEASLTRMSEDEFGRDFAVDVEKA